MHVYVNEDRIILLRIHNNVFLCNILACTLPRMRTSKRLTGQPPEGQKRREVGSADSREASPRPGFARERLSLLFRTEYALPLCVWSDNPLCRLLSSPPWTL